MARIRHWKCSSLRAGMTSVETLVRMQFGLLNKEIWSSSVRKYGSSQCRAGEVPRTELSKVTARFQFSHATGNDEFRAGANERDYRNYVPKVDDLTGFKSNVSAVPTTLQTKSKKPSSVRGFRGNLFLDGIEGRENVVKYMDHSIDLDAILESLKESSTEEEMKAIMAQWKGKLSQRLMMSLLKQERDWQRSLALLDWMLEDGGYKPSTFGYNIVIRNVLKARRWTLGEGLVSEMTEKGVVPDKYTYSSLISAFGKAGKFESAVMWLQRMEENGVRPDLVIYSTVIELAGKLKNFPKAVSLFTKMKEAGSS